MVGQNIGKYQAIAFKIARMEARAHTARLAYYDAAARMLAGKPFKTQAASVFIFSQVESDNPVGASAVSVVLLVVALVVLLIFGWLSKRVLRHEE